MIRLIWILYIFSTCIIDAHEFEFGPCVLQYLEPCSTDTIQFHLFTNDSSSGSTPLLLNGEDSGVPEWVDLGRMNKMILHGYAGSLDFNATKEIRMAYLSRPDTNVIVVDWSRLAKLPCYPSAAFNTKQAGECTANFIIDLLALDRGFSVENLHMIGFSLGAHAASFASNSLEKLIKQRVKRITGLDPALPFFSTTDVDWKLDGSDADFVDVIHTNAGIFGKIESSGHIDFYINGGQNQPACENHRNQPLCSHLMASEYFAESIVGEKKFYGVYCESYFMHVFGFCPDGYFSDDYEFFLGRNDKIAVMGEQCSESDYGIYFVTTNDRPPYAMDVLQIAGDGKVGREVLKQKRI